MPNFFHIIMQFIPHWLEPSVKRLLESRIALFNLQRSYLDLLPRVASITLCMYFGIA